MKLGQIIRTKSFTDVYPQIEYTYRAPARGKVYVFMMLGVENKDGSEPLDLFKVMDQLGWAPKSEE